MSRVRLATDEWPEYASRVPVLAPFSAAMMTADPYG
jgi:hypothetical protein